ncbi:MAG: hypothetical protein U9Q67_04880, partial [Patescibacteria group bacterium]|nr:hypothetical protein [Patescibacteria group bacterium]
LASFNLDYENTGTTFYIPEGTVEVRGWSGKLKDRAVLDSHFIFPQSIQNYDFAWPYEQELVGYYNVTVSFADGEGNIDTETVGIWIISMWDMVIFLLILIVVSLTLYLFAKYRGKKKKRRK